MYSLEALKQVCMLQIPKLLTEDNVVDILYSISQSEGLGKHHLTCSCSGNATQAWVHYCHECSIYSRFSALTYTMQTAIVQQLCYNFIAKNFQKVTKSEAFCKLPQEQMLELVQSTASKLKM